ncbi:MAG: DNA gyrase C-terminal beta-propeller domain-containing protein, partial [Novosphingobium sp.]
PATRGRPIVNMLPALDKDETIATVLPLPEDENTWGALSVVFATAKGNVRRNSMDAFANVPSNGKFAMRFDDGSEDRLIGVALLDPTDDVLLASRSGKAIRFAGDEVREFTSRTSTGVRGMLLKGDDEVISLSILHRVGTSAEEREQYVRFAPWKGEKEGEPSLTAERMAELAEREQFILTVCANGYGKMSSAYEYRRTGRGGQGITNIDNIGRNGPVVASFPAVQADQLMLVTDQAKLIRLPLESLRVIGRGSAGVRLFSVADAEHVVSAVRLADSGEDEAEVEDIAATEAAPEAPTDDAEPAAE